MSKERGKISIGLIFFSGLFVLGLHIAYQIIPAYINYLNFKNEIISRTMESQIQSTDSLRNDLMKKAAEYNIPLEEDNLIIDLDNRTVHIKATWSVDAKLLGSYYIKRLTFAPEYFSANLKG